MHYQPRKCLRTVAAVLLAFGAAVAAPAVAAAHPSRGGFVYVNDNTAGTNTVAAFVRHPNGGLTPVPGRRSSPAAPGRARELAEGGRPILSPVALPVAEHSSRATAVTGVGVNEPRAPTTLRDRIRLKRGVRRSMSLATRCGQLGAWRSNRSRDRIRVPVRAELAIALATSRNSAKTRS
jgi:hypothetical protein